MEKVLKVGRLLSELSTFCDTGYALAFHLRFAGPILLYQTYDPEWIKFYNERGFTLYDPVIRWGLRETGVIRWNEIPDEDPQDVSGHAKRFGFKGGLAFATGPTTSRTICGLSNSAGVFTAEETVALTAMLQQIHDITEDFSGFDPAEQELLRNLSPGAPPAG